MSDADFIREVEALYQRIAEADTDSFFELAKIAGLNIKTGLVGTDLRNVNLRETSFWQANLSGANLSGANLSGANLWEANLSGANLSRANLIRANLIRANLNGANLNGANLSGANLSDTDLSRANLSGTDLSGADLKNSQIDEQTTIADKWRLVWEILNVVRENRQLTQVDLSEANLRLSNLVGVDLRWSNLSQYLSQKKRMKRED